MRKVSVPGITLLTNLAIVATAENQVVGVKYTEALNILGRVAWWLATCSRKPKVPGSSPATSYVQR